MLYMVLLDGRHTRVVKEERVVWLGILDQPVHGAQDVGLGRLAHGVLLVVGQEHHILALVAKELVQIGAHVLDVVDAAAQLPALAKVVDANQQRLAAAVAGRVLERVAVGGAVAKVLGACGRGRWSLVVALGPLVVVDGGYVAVLLWRIPVLLRWGRGCRLAIATAIALMLRRPNSAFISISALLSFLCPAAVRHTRLTAHHSSAVGAGILVEAGRHIRSAVAVPHSRCCGTAGPDS